MIAPALTTPEALLVLLGPSAHPVVVTAGVLSELARRGRIGVSSADAAEPGQAARTTRFRLDIVDRASTGDPLLDATLTKAQGLTEHGSHLVGADAMNRRLQSVQLRDKYLARLRAQGWFAEPTAKSSFLRRRAHGPVPPDTVPAIRERLASSVLDDAPLEPIDRDLVALLAVAEGAGRLGRALWQLIVTDPRVSAKAREREAMRMRALERIAALVDADPVATAVSLTLSDRPAGVDR